MASWIVLCLVALIGIALFLFFKEKVKHIKTKTVVLIILVFLLFFYFTGSKIIKDNHVDLKTFSGFVTAGKLYFIWMGNAFDNTKTIAGNVVNMDWNTNSTGG